MTAPAAPPVLPRVFAASAGGGFITNPIPDTTGTAGAASFTDGFPPETMTPPASGGVPPFGQDVNGILNMLSAHLVYLQAGLPYLFSSAESTVLGGYPIGSIVGMADGTGLWLNTQAANTTDPDGGSAAGWVALASYGLISLGGLTGGSISLTPAQSRRKIIAFTGTLTSNLTVTFPATVQEWLIINDTSGAFTLTCTTGAANTVVVTQGGQSSPTGIYGDGTTGLFPSTTPLTVPISVAPTAGTLVERDSSGYAFATYFNQNSSSTENPAAGAVFVENTGHDGYLRKCTLAALSAQLALSNVGGQVGASQVPLAAVAQFISFSGGVVKIPLAGGGTLVIQAGTVNGGSGTNASRAVAVTFPQAMTTLLGFAPTITGTGANDTAYAALSYYGASGAGLTLYFRNVTTGTINYTASYIAIGIL